MKRVKRLILILGAILILIAELMVVSCGKAEEEVPVEEELPPKKETPEKGEIFNLKSWGFVVFNPAWNHQLDLELHFTTAEDVEIYLINPEGTEIASEKVKLGVTKAELPFADAVFSIKDWSEPKEFKLYVREIPSQEVVFTKTFLFRGPKLVINDLEVELEPALITERYKYDFRIDSVTLTITNEGDFPIFVREGYLYTPEEEFYLDMVPGYFFIPGREIITENVFDFGSLTNAGGLIRVELIGATWSIREAYKSLGVVASGSKVITP